MSKHSYVKAPAQGGGPGGGGSSDIGCRVFQNGMVVPHAVATPIDYSGGPLYDTDNMFDMTFPTRINFKTAGKYVVGLIACFGADSTGIRAVSLTRFGTNTTFLAEDSYKAFSELGIGGVLKINLVTEFQVGDYMEATVYQNSGGDLVLSPSGTAFGAPMTIWAQKVG